MSKKARPGGLRSVVAKSVLIKHQLLIVNRSRHRGPNLCVLDRLIAGLCSLWIKPTRLLRTAIVLEPSTVLHFHRALVQRKYPVLFSPKREPSPGQKVQSRNAGMHVSEESDHAIVPMNQPNNEEFSSAEAGGGKGRGPRRTSFSPTRVRHRAGNECPKD
jgi:hypothetical protein